MAKYRTDVDILISHECRIAKAGEEFETDFPKGMELGENLHLVKAKPGRKPAGRPKLADTSSPE